MTTLDLTKIDPKTLLGASKTDLIKLATELSELKARAGQIGPQTPDELHEYIHKNYGIWVPRKAVTPGHCAPFDFLADAYFQKETSQLVIACREGSKTFTVGLLQVLFARFFPGYEGLTAGAIEYQTVRAYQAIRKLNNIFGKDQVEDSQQSRTIWKNGSTVEILTMTYEAMNGPHTWFLHRDEIELARRNAFDEADSITRSGVTKDGRSFRAHDVLTSTRKLARGKVQELLDQCEEAERAGRKPPYKVYKWGVAETVQNQPNCRYHAPPGTPEDKLCPCNQYVNGFIGDPKNGIPRTLEAVCGGRFGKSDGWRPLEDIAGKFMKTSQAMWDAQYECKKPASEGLILVNYDEAINGIRNYIPDPANGRIFNSNDFGGANPFASHWYQLLDRDVEVRSFANEPKVLPKGSLVCFDEIYRADIGNNEFFSMIVAKERQYKELFGDEWKVFERYADIAGRAQRKDMLNHDPPLPTVWRIERDVESHINTINERIDQGLLYVDVDKCPKWNEEAQFWQRDPNTGRELQVANHAMAALRYAAENIKALIQLERKAGRRNDGPVAPGSEHVAELSRVPVTGPARSAITELPHDIPIHRQPVRPGDGPHAGRRHIIMDDIW